jgi:hypothetical protein
MTLYHFYRHCIDYRTGRPYSRRAALWYSVDMGDVLTVCGIVATVAWMVWGIRTVRMR